MTKQKGIYIFKTTFCFLTYKTGGVMNLSVGNKNIILGIIIILLYLSVTFFIERTAALHQFHSKSAGVVIDTKGTENLLDDEVVDFQKGNAYRTGGIYFTNYYPVTYVAVPNFFKDAGYNMRLYGWIFALFGIAIGAIVGIQKNKTALGNWASWLAFIAVILYPIRDAVYFWGRWFNATFSPTSVGPLLYPIMWIGGIAMFLALLFSLIVFMKGVKA